MKTKKIIKVLKFIKGYCQCRNCKCCKFSDSLTCYLSDGDGNLPDHWDIENIEINLKDIKKIDMYKGGGIDENTN